MHFSHHPSVWTQHPELAAGALFAPGIRKDVDAGPLTERYEAMARARLAAAGSESELAEIQAWRRTFSRMGLKPTQYRCASESLLRRLRKEGAMPRIHPLVDLCNAISMAFAIPVAVIDTGKVVASLQVRPADGSERYLTFGGEIEHPDPGEISFVDAQGNAHARRWTNRQSGLSAVRDDTAQVLVVAVAMHAGAREDIARLVATLTEALESAWGVRPQSGMLDAQAPRFDFEPAVSSAVRGSASCCAPAASRPAGSPPAPSP